MGVNDYDHQELEAFDTLSLTDFPLTKDANSCGQESQDHDKHPNPPSPATEDLFEFCSGGSNGLCEQHMMSHAEDMISGGKLIPIKNQPNHEQAPRKQNQNPNEKHIHGGRCESMRELKGIHNKGTASQLFRNSYSLDSKKLNKTSRSNYEPSADNNRNSLSNKSSSSRWTDHVFAPLKVPQEMDLRDIRNRQVVQNTSISLFPAVEASDRFAVTDGGGGGRLRIKICATVRSTYCASMVELVTGNADCAVVSDGFFRQELS
ncbi:hypothetical protein L1987_49887 [Smallanthus sonchifolius]|uniref:Uncharacterized protein n=1 Tax=Smallanthus sonchifolius TaxID=185202 RepID=A0ACB9FWZ6_9ASTR|nr:hypothetical protein L1987_49887 [Smallanthus sonchifolius]